MPQGVNGEGAKAVAEGEGLLAGVEHVPGDQAAAEAVGEVAQAGQVLGVDGGAGLDLDGQHPAVGGLQDGVDLGLVLGAVVMQARAFRHQVSWRASSISTNVSIMGPAAPSGSPRRVASWPSRCAGNAGVDEGQLGRADGPLGLAG